MPRSDSPTATLLDLAKYEALIAFCGARRPDGSWCRHKGHVTPSALPKGFPVSTMIRDLPRYLRCTACGQKSEWTQVGVFRR